MKKLLLAFALLVPGLAYADRNVFITPGNIYIGDGVNKPLPTVAAAPYLVSWLGGTYLALSPATGVSLSAEVNIPMDAVKGQKATIYVTLAYSVTNTATAALSVTAKSDFTSIVDSSATTTAANTATVFAAQTVPTAAGNQLYDLEIGQLTVYPGQKITLYGERSAGTAGILYVARLWVRYKNAGWF